jgi:hypothetical protein
MEEYKIQYKIDDEDPVEINLKDYENDAEYDDENIHFSMDDMFGELPVLQLKFPCSYFWTDFENDYMWFEFLDHPYTAANNNFVAIGGLHLHCRFAILKKNFILKKMIHCIELDSILVT